MERRFFIKNTGLVIGAGLVSPQLVLPKELEQSTKITILHTNDTHSNVEALPANHAKFPNKGGVSKRFELIEKIRKEEEHVLLLDAGDIFQGTPYFNRFGGVLELKLMSQLGYDAATMGNHDFDGGMDGFFIAKAHANFPFICSNYDFTNTVLDTHTESYKIFKKGKIKIGVFGLGVDPKGLIPPILVKETKYLDPIEIAQDMVRKLKQQKVDLIICLSHLGYEYSSTKISDLKLAAATTGINLIIGGHTHTFLDRPTVVMNNEQQPVIVNQVGWAGIQMGRIDFYVGKSVKNKSDLLVIE